MIVCHFNLGMLKFIYFWWNIYYYIKIGCEKLKFNKSIISILMLFAVLSTMTVAFAADQSWNDATYTIPDGFSVGTPGVQKIGMMDGKQSVILEKLNESRLDELKEASKPVDEKTYKIENTDVTETVFDTETGKLHFLKFAKD